MPEHQPGEPASATGLYREVNVFGSPTGRIVRAERGERLPLAPRGFGWRLTKRPRRTTALLSKLRVRRLLVSTADDVDRGAGNQCVLL